MKKIKKYLSEYYHKNFNTRLYAWVLSFLIICIALEYVFHLRKQYTQPLDHRLALWPVMTLHHFLPFIYACLVIYFLKLKKNFLVKKGFWVRCLIGFSLLGLDQSNFYNGFLDRLFGGYDLFFLSRVWGWLNSLFILVLPLILLNKILETGKDRNLYGLYFKKFDAKPYLLLLLMTSVILFAGSFWPDLHNYYPRYLHSYGAKFANENQLGQWIPVIIYESAYSSNFISVELFFRGFLIMTFYRYLGDYVVIPMVVSYCFLHFGKPIGETISSIFGGYVLGVISLNTRNIWGGIILHIGVALLMELFTCLQNMS